MANISFDHSDECKDEVDFSNLHLVIEAYHELFSNSSLKLTENIRRVVKIFSYQIDALKTNYFPLNHSSFKENNLMEENEIVKKELKNLKENYNIISLEFKEN